MQVGAIGTEYEGCASSWGQWHVDGAPYDVSIGVYDLVSEPFDYSIDWTVPDCKLAGGADALTVKMWMQEPYCELPDPIYWDYYAWIVQQVIDRYAPQYVSIWNEPDMGYAYPEYFGCMGEDAGALYGQFVRHIFLSIHGLDDNPDLDTLAYSKGTTQILMGEVASVNNGFLIDALDAAQGSYDAVSIHCYEYYNQGYLTDNCISNYQYAQTLTDKPVHLTETAVICDGDCNNDTFFDAQITHYERLRLNIKTTSYWYTGGYNSWRNTDFIGKTYSGELFARPVWQLHNEYHHPVNDTR